MPHKTLTREAVAKNNTEDSLWFVIDSKVYDVTDFVDAHPGGESVLKQGTHPQQSCAACGSQCCSCRDRCNRGFLQSSSPGGPSEILQLMYRHRRRREVSGPRAEARRPERCSLRRANMADAAVQEPVLQGESQTAAACFARLG